MNKEIKEKWIAALRSGNYKQGEALLRDKDDNFCCLGVLCDIVEPNAWIRRRHYYELPDSKWGPYKSSLPEHIRNLTEVGVSGQLPSPVGRHYSLVSLNDSAEYSFDQIADVIENQF